MLNSKLLLPLLMLAPYAKADVPNGSGYPYLAESNCLKSAKIPENSGGILFNRDCSVGFVLPEAIGRATLMPRASANLRLCDSLAEMQDEVVNYNQIIKSWKAKLKNTATVEEAQKIKALIQDILELQKDAKRSVDRIEGMRVNVTFENRGSAPVHAAQELNKEIFGDSVRFQAVPISQGRLQYIVASPNSDEGIDFQTVLKSTIPGNDRIINGDQGEVDFNGAIQGELTLTLSGACPFIEKVKSGGKTYLSLNEQAVNQTITATYTYAVPVQSSVSYKATLDAKAALTSLQERTAVTEKFNRNEFVNSLVDSQGSQKISITISKHEMPEGESLEQFSSMLKSGIAERLTTQLLDILAKNNYVTAGIPAFVVPEAKTDSIEAIRRECRSSSSLFGLMKSSRCYDVPYRITVDVANRARLFTELATSWNFPIEESAEMTEIIYRRNTSTFNLQPTQKVIMEVK